MKKADIPQPQASIHRSEILRWIAGGIIGTLIFIVIIGIAYHARTSIAIIALIPGMVAVMLSSSWKILANPGFGETLGMITVFGISALPFALAGALLASGGRSKVIAALVLLFGYLALLTLCGLIFLLPGQG
jgi:hypothetical protein